MAKQLTVPALLQIALANGTMLTGRFARYTDPGEMSPYEPFHTTDMDGVNQYIHGATILRVTVFPLATAETQSGTTAADAASEEALP